MREHSDAEPRTESECFLTMGSSSRRKRKRKRAFEWEKTFSLPEDRCLDTIEEEESGSDDSGIAIGDADFDERDTDHDSEVETDS